MSVEIKLLTVSEILHEIPTVFVSRNSHASIDTKPGQVSPEDNRVEIAVAMSHQIIVILPLQPVHESLQNLFRLARLDFDPFEKQFSFGFDNAVHFGSLGIDVASGYHVLMVFFASFAINGANGNDLHISVLITSISSCGFQVVENYRGCHFGIVLSAKLSFIYTSQRKVLFFNHATSLK